MNDLSSNNSKSVDNIEMKNVIDAVKCNELLWDEIFRYNFDVLAEEYNDTSLAYIRLLKDIKRELRRQSILSEQNVYDYIRSITQCDNQAIQSFYKETLMTNLNDVDSVRYVIAKILGENSAVEYIKKHL